MEASYTGVNATNSANLQTSSSSLPPTNNNNTLPPSSPNDPLTTHLTHLVHHYLSLSHPQTSSFYATLLLSHTGPLPTTLQLRSLVRSRTKDNDDAVIATKVKGYHMAVALANKGRYREAVDELRPLLSNSPPPTVHALLGRCYHSLGNPRLALHHDSIAVKEDEWLWESRRRV
eukprot:CAMPEP_0118634454 /NCGR_PEP_ID=MMETSP0785-20121206/1553_1 /TAXON_ID=91992 /ORGANISM="Bolidomonas pacifica, Strain CCMP 1866" /LENGTH=173 /DNA_ID=CAMNT_0006525425 /DNA_START=31 /DNA_END=548 /DNA_ORIENTATION=+